MSPSLLYLKPLRNSNTFLHVIYKSKKKTNLLCILNNVFQYSKIRTRKPNAKKSIKTEKIWNPALFGIRNPVLGIRNPQGGIQNPRLSWILLHGATQKKLRTPIQCLNVTLLTKKTLFSLSLRNQSVLVTCCEDLCIQTVFRFANTRNRNRGKKIEFVSGPLP